MCNHRGTCPWLAECALEGYGPTLLCSPPGSCELTQCAALKVLSRPLMYSHPGSCPRLAECALEGLGPTQKCSPLALVSSLEALLSGFFGAPPDVQPFWLVPLGRRVCSRRLWRFFDTPPSWLVALARDGTLIAFWAPQHCAFQSRVPYFQRYSLSRACPYKEPAWLVCLAGGGAFKI